MALNSADTNLAEADAQYPRGWLEWAIHHAGDLFLAFLNGIIQIDRFGPLSEKVRKS